MHYYCTIELQEILSPVGRGHWLMPLIHGSFQQVRTCCCLCVLLTLSLYTALLTLLCSTLLHICATLHYIYISCSL